MVYTLDSLTENIFDNVFLFFGKLTAEGFVLELNGQVFRNSNVDTQLLVGQKFSDTVYWQSSELTSSILSQAVAAAAKGNKSATLLDFRVSSQEKLTISLYLHPLFDEGSKVKSIFFCAKDLTEQQKEIAFYKNRGNQLQDAAENAEIGLWYWDLAEDNIFSTPKCNELFEVPPQVAITLQTILNIIHPQDRQRIKLALDKSRANGKKYNIEFRVIYSDGHIHWIAARGKTFIDEEGNPKNMAGVVRKITEKKIASEELSKIYALEKKALDEAEEANRAKDFFLAVVSHELRSPLNSILGWAKILLTKQVNEETKINALQTIEKSARSQAKLIEDLIDSSRVASGKLRLELRPVNLYEIIKTVYNSQQPAAEAKKISLSFSADNENIQVFGDSMRLQQVFTNLLSNALKFTQENGAIGLNIETGNKSVKVAVTDDGQGIRPDILPNIFAQFQQGDQNVTHDRSGLGLGLSIVKILTEKHNGKITAESDGINCGSTFTVLLPLCGITNDTEKQIPDLSQIENKPLDGLKILIVEDDQDSREVLQLFLEQSGALVQSAESAAEAINLLGKSTSSLPDAIVSDLAMPEEDGYSLIERIRELSAEKGGNIPALALSAFASSENKQRALNAGFQKYHTKPFEPDGIIEDIRQITNK
jgi:PAS domain S-box-containing protein